MINDQGGINGRKINFISYDDAYSPPKTVEQTRKLVESDEVLFIFNGLGTASQTAVQKYMNTQKVPQLFVATGASKWNDPKDFPWTMGWQPSYRVEARIIAKYVLKTKPDAKVAVFYANDDFGKDYVAGLKDVFGDNWPKIVIAQESYENSEPSIDSHIVKLKDSGADVFVNICDAEIRSTGHQEGGRDRVEADATSDQRRDLDRRRHEAGRSRGVRRRAVGRLSEGCVGPAVGQ